MTPCGPQNVLIQWALDVPTDWVCIDAADWASLPTKPDPKPGDTPDNRLGWINRICVQGVEFTADHYAVEPLTEGVRIYTWSDAPSRDGRPGYEQGTRYARVWDFLPLAPDSRFGGAYNTRQTQILYGDPEVLDYHRSLHRQNGLPANLVLKPWSAFNPPNHIAKHGCWIPDTLYQEHESIRPTRGWREWCADLPAEEQENGKLRQQRAIGRYDIPDGTRTYYHNATDLANGIHAADHENALGISPAGATSETSGNYGGGSDALSWTAVSPSNEPNSAAWPTGNYRAQLDVTAAGADMTFGLLTLGGSAGHFARVNSGITSDLETKAQQESAFSGSGLHLATTGSVSWTAGNATDRFEIVIAGQRGANHGNQNFTLQLGETDDFADGPWPAAVTQKMPILSQEGVHSVIFGGQVIS